MKLDIVYALLIAITFIGFTINFSDLIPAFSDGLTEERLPPASVGDRQASLFTKISPPILTSESQEDAFFQVRLFDEKTGNTIEHVSYFITVTKGDNLLMRELFHSHQGLLTLKIQPREGPVNIFGTREPFLNAFTSETGNVSVIGPILLEGGLYRFSIEIFGIDNDRNIFVPEDAPRFDSWLSVGDIFKPDIDFKGQNQNLSIVSYYDKVEDFIFDDDSLSISYSMPFNWNLSRIEDQSIFVHQEIHIPKTFGPLGNTTSYSATVNGEPVTGRSLAVDPFTSEDSTIVHYLINKNDILRLAEREQNFTAGTMAFTLSLGNQGQTTSSDLVTDTGNIYAAVQWSPIPLNSEAQSTLSINFSDALDDTPLQADVLYDLSIIDESGNSIIALEGLTAENATDVQTLDFPAEEIYQVELTVNGLKFADQSSIDTTRNGIARGYVVVPEFPYAIVLLLVSTIAIIAVQRFGGLPARSLI